MYLQLLARGSCQEYGASVYHERVVPSIRNRQLARPSGLLKSEVFPLVFVLYAPVLLLLTCTWVSILQVSCMLHPRLPSSPRYEVRIDLMI